MSVDQNAYTVSHVNRPLPFKVRLLPRSEKIAKLVKQAGEDALPALQAYEAVTKVTFESAQSVSLDMPIAHSEKN